MLTEPHTLDAPAAALSAPVRERVEDFLVTLRRSPWYGPVRAVVVSGSAARGEELWDEGRMVSDIDLLLITGGGSLVVGRALKNILRRHGLAGIDGSRIALRAFRSYRTLAFYEAHRSGVLVDGDAAVFDGAAMRGPQDIPHWEAVRLTANRLFELIKLDLGETTRRAATAKAYEAIGEAALVAEGRYRPSFRERLLEIRQRAIDIPLEGVADTVVAVYEHRVDGASLPVLDPARARDDLIAMLGTLLGSGPRGAEVARSLDALSRERRSAARGLYWIAHQTLRRERAGSALRADPCIQLWCQAVDAATRPRSSDEARRLVAAWRACPQPLERAEAP